VSVPPRMIYGGMVATSLYMTVELGVIDGAVLLALTLALHATDPRIRDSEGSA